MLLDPFGPPSPTNISPNGLPSLSSIPKYISPTIEVGGVVYYDGGPNGLKNASKFNDDREAIRDLSNFTSAVQLCAAIWRANGGTDFAPLERAHSLLDCWARAGALMYTTNEQAKAHRRWHFCGLAIAYLSIRGAVKDLSCQTIESWMNKIGSLSLESAKRYTNNHYYWSGAAGICGAVASNNRSLFLASLKVGLDGIANIQTNGTLESEIERGTRSLGYHSFALLPLIIIAEMALANGVNIYDANDQAIFRLADYIISKFGVDPPNSVPSWPWLLAKRHDDQKVEELTSKATRFDPYAGGRVDILFASIAGGKIAN